MIRAPVCVVHVAPFDASRYPPLINTVALSRAAGLTSIVVASAPLRSPDVLDGARIIAPAEAMGGGGQQLFLIRNVRALARETRPALVIGHNGRGICAATVATAAYRIPVVYHCHDFEGDQILRDRVVKFGEKLAAPHAAEIWVPTVERKEIARTRRLGNRTLVVRNCPRRLASLPPRGRLRAWLAANGSRSSGQGRILIRHGAVGSAHCIRETIEAMPLLPEDVELVVVGDGDTEYIRECEALAPRLGLGGRVFFHPYVAHTELTSLLVDADVAMGLYAPNDMNSASPAPNKIYESMAAGLSVVVGEDNYSVAADVAAAGAGVAVRLGSREALAAAFTRLLEDSPFARRCRTSARESHLRELNYETELRDTMLGALMLQATEAA